MPARAHRAARYVVYSQLSFFAMIAACVALAPHAMLEHRALSFFGTNRLTTVPYTIGLLFCGYFLVKAAHVLPQATRTLRMLTEALLVLAVLIVIVCLTPYSVDIVFDWVHMTASAFLFALELSVAGWLVYGACRSVFSVLLLLGQLAASVVAMLSEVSILNFMLSGEILAQLAFGILLIVCLHQLTSPYAAAERAGAGLSSVAAGEDGEPR